MKSFYAPQEVQDPPARSSCSPRMIVAASENGQRPYESMKSDIHTQIFLALTLVIKLIGLQSGAVMAGGRQSGRYRRCFWCRCISPPADKDRADECGIVLPSMMREPMMRSGTTAFSTHLTSGVIASKALTPTPPSQ